MKKIRSEIVEKLFQYDEYRNFLKDYFEEQKNLRRVFTYRYFAQKAGFSAHNFCMRVIAGKRNLGHTSIPKICKAMDLKGKSAKYFETLVEYNQTDDLAKKQKLSEELNSIRLSTTLFNDSKNEVLFFGKWYYPVVRELATSIKWDNDYSTLASAVIPAISKHEAQEAVKTMVESGLLNVDKQGNYTISEHFLSAENVSPVIKKKYRRDILAIGVDAAEKFSASERFTSVSTFSLSREAYEKIVSIYEDAVDEMLSVAAADGEKSEKVYHISTNIFPASTETDSQEEGEK